MTRYRIRFGSDSKKEDIEHKVAVGVSIIRDHGQKTGSRLANAVSRHLQRNQPNNDPDDTPRSALDQRVQFLRSLIVRILFCLDKVGLDRVKEEFLCQPKQELTIVQFVSLMVRVTCESDNQLLFSEVDIKDVAQALAELFDTMDLNGSHTIEFAEFLETCIHWGLSSGGGIESRQILDDPIAPFTSGPRSRIDSRVTKKFLFYLDILDLVLVFEPIARKLLIMDPDYLSITRTAFIGEKRATAVEYIHVDSQGMARRLTAVAFARYIILYEGLLAGRFSEHSRIPIRVKLTSLRWMQYADLLVGAGCNGAVFAWNLDGRLVQVIKGHSGSISSMVIVPESHQVLTGSTDRSIRLRDLQFSKRSDKFTYTGHNGAVTCLAVNTARTEFVSGSTCGELFVWSLIDSHVLHRISGHSRSIAFASFVSDSPEFISGDEAGNYRIWDSRLAFSNVETIPVGTLGLNHFGTTICTKRDTRILVPSDFDVLSWDQRTQRKDRRRKREVNTHAEENLIFGEYLEPSCLFVTATSRTIRFWNALNGCLKEQYDNIMDAADIAAICFDKSSRKMIVGDNRGRMHIFNAMSGGIMKKLVPHGDEIVGLKYIVTQTERLVVSLSRDGRLRTHDEAPLQSCPVRLDFRLEQIGVHRATVLAASSMLAMAAVGDQSGRVTVWNLNTNRIADTIRQAGSISGLEFLGTYSLLAVANGTPVVALYALEPQIQHGSCLLTIDSLSADILSSVFVNDTRVLYVSDAAGYVSGFDLNLMIDQYQVLPVVRRQQKMPDGDQKKELKLASRKMTFSQLFNRAQTAAAHGAPRTIRFHADTCAIASVGLIGEPLSLFVLSFGPHLTVWSVDGHRLGTLGTLDICRRSKQKIDWRFQVDTGKRLYRADAVARQVLQSLVIQHQVQASLASKAESNHDREMQSTSAGTFLTQEALPKIVRSAPALSTQSHLKRSRSELLPASMFHSDGDTLTLEKRQEIRNLKRSSGNQTKLPGSYFNSKVMPRLFASQSQHFYSMHQQDATEVSVPTE